jgi:prepilin peptidase CpaA
LEDDLESIILLLGIALLAAAAYGDVKTLRIPNSLVLAVAALGLLRLIVIGDLSVALYTLGASAIIFIATFLLFWRGFLGGGDAKLLTAAALLVGYNDLFHFLLVMSICGGLVSIAVLFMRRSSVMVASDEQPLLKAALAVPYGAAIAGGGIVILLFQSSFLG